MIDKEIEAIFAGQDVGGAVDVDGVLEAFERLRSIATEADLPTLVAAIQSPRNNFWTRDLFADPICQLGGVDYLEPLFEAAQLNLDDGHDNDSFNMSLTELAYLERDKCRIKLNDLLARADFRHREAASWLLEFCETGEPDAMT